MDTLSLDIFSWHDWSTRHACFCFVSWSLRSFSDWNSLLFDFRQFLFRGLFRFVVAEITFWQELFAFWFSHSLVLWGQDSHEGGVVDENLEGWKTLIITRINTENSNREPGLRARISCDIDSLSTISHLKNNWRVEASILFTCLAVVEKSLNFSANSGSATRFDSKDEIPFSTRSFPSSTQKFSDESSS